MKASFFRWRLARVKVLRRCLLPQVTSVFSLVETKTIPALPKDTDWDACAGKTNTMYKPLVVYPNLSTVQCRK